MKIHFMRSFRFCTETFDSFKTIKGAIVVETVRIAKRNMEKVLNGLVRRQQALEQETHKKVRRQIEVN